MKLLICHLSDIHFSSQSNNLLLSKQNKIFDAFKNELLMYDELLFLISGDIANKGNEEEYKIAKKFFDDLRIQIANYKVDINISFVFSPGNHDCLFNNDESIRESLCETIRKGIVTDAFVELLTQSQTNYRNFITKFYEDKNNLKSTRLLDRHELKFGDYKIYVDSYNSSWMSEKKEVYGNLIFPLDKISDIENRNDGLKISILHHNFSWFKNQRELKNFIEKNTDIIFTGHEHVNSYEERKSLNQSGILQIEGGELQSNSHNDSKFNLIFIDFKKSEMKYLSKLWDGTNYIVSSESEWEKLEKMDSQHISLLRIKPEFENYLNDLEAQLSHPRKNNFNLEDIFIYPSLKKLTKSIKSKDYDKDVYSSKEIVGSNIDGKVLVLGEERSGKTTLSKIIFKNAYFHKQLPIYIDCDKIKLNNIDEFNKKIKKEFLNQYNSSQYLFDEEDINNIVLIIDNYSRIGLNSAKKVELFAEINSFYKNIVVFVDEYFYLEERLQGKESSAHFESFKVYQLMEFGHELRERLITKWNKLGCEEEIEECDLHYKNKKAKILIDNIVGKNVVPSYPIFLLTSLQTLESGNSHKLEDSSYSYYYECLLTQAFSRLSSLKDDDVGGYFNYLTNLAYKLYISNLKEITENEYIEFHKKFIDDYDIGPIQKNLYDYSILKRDLLLCDVLKENEDSFRFKYNYIYFYFVARYLSLNIEKNDVRTIVESMCKKVYLSENANILVFIIHHKKVDFIIDELLNNMEKIFEEVSIAKLEDDVKIIDSLVKDLKEAIIDERNLDYLENNRQINSEKDKLEYNNQESFEELDDEEKGNIEIANNLNTGFKYVEIVGQILKNYSSSLESEIKTKLIEESYFLALRTVNFFSSAISENIERFKSEISKNLLNKEILDSEIKYKYINNFIFNIFGLVSIMLMKKVSNNIGNDRLLITYDKVLKKNDYNSINLIDISIRLDFFKNIPLAKIKELNKKFKGNWTSKFILQQMVINYLYMFPVKFNIRQQICDELSIKLKPQKLSYNKS